MDNPNVTVVEDGIEIPLSKSECKCVEFLEDGTGKCKEFCAYVRANGLNFYTVWDDVPSMMVRVMCYDNCDSGNMLTGVCSVSYKYLNTNQVFSKEVFSKVMKMKNDVDHELKKIFECALAAEKNNETV